MKLICLTAIWLSATLGFAQQPHQNEFDFWVGEWDAYWGDSLRGTNTITKEQNNFVLHEHFADFKGFTGESWSVFSVAEQKWKQTWVDNTGAYIALTGEFIHHDMILFCEKTVKGKTVKFKMHYKNIAADSFDWEWSSLPDGESEWRVLWAIHYKRKK